MITLCFKTHREENKVFLVVLSDAVVHPGTVVVHLFDAAFTHTVDTQIHNIDEGYSRGFQR